MPDLLCNAALCDLHCYSSPAGLQASLDNPKPLRSNQAVERSSSKDYNHTRIITALPLSIMVQTLPAWYFHIWHIYATLSLISSRCALHQQTPQNQPQRTRHCRSILGCQAYGLIASSVTHCFACLKSLLKPGSQPWWLLCRCNNSIIAGPGWPSRLGCAFAVFECF